MTSRPFRQRCLLGVGLCALALGTFANGLALLDAGLGRASMTFILAFGFGFIGLQFCIVFGPHLQEWPEPPDTEAPFDSKVEWDKAMHETSRILRIAAIVAATLSAATGFLCLVGLLPPRTLALAVCFGLQAVAFHALSKQRGTRPDAPAC